MTRARCTLLIWAALLLYGGAMRGARGEPLALLDHGLPAAAALYLARKADR